MSYYKICRLNNGSTYQNNPFCRNYSTMRPFEYYKKSFKICNKNRIEYDKINTIKASNILVMTILILALTSSISDDKEALAVDPSMIPTPSPASPPPPPLPPSNKNADQQGQVIDNNGVLSRQVSPDIKAQAIIDSQIEKECFNYLIRGIVDATSGEFDEQANDLKAIAIFSDRAAYAYFCYIAGGNIVDLLLENP